MSTVVLLSGGSGMRLWPLSNEARSKQFLKVLRDKDGKPQSMVQRVISQIRAADPSATIVIATSAAQVSSIHAQIEGDYGVALEPMRRDTASAIMLAGAYLHSVENLGDDEPLVVMPIDSYVDDGYFELIEALDAAVRDDVADIVLLGVKPTRPSESYGYIVPEYAEATEGAGGVMSERAAGCADGRASAQADGLAFVQPDGQACNAMSVKEFKEKPSRDEAEKLIAEGALWNCGVFAFKLGYIRAIAARYTDAAAYDDLAASYADLPKKSFDYEVVEQAESVSVIAYDGMWKDLGTWNTLAGEMSDSQAGRVIGNDIAGTHIVNELNIPLVALGVHDAVIVATPDGILVSDKAASANMKPYVERAAEDRAMYEARSWGDYRVLDHTAYSSGARSLTKYLRISAGRQISYQRHKLREEIWTVVEGSGEVVVEGVVRSVGRGDAVSIPRGSLHGIRALADLHIVEVQLGSLLTEDDIERFGFYWD